MKISDKISLQIMPNTIDNRLILLNQGSFLTGACNDFNTSAKKVGPLRKHIFDGSLSIQHLCWRAVLPV
jgi:hypothetical protein